MSKLSNALHKVFGFVQAKEPAVEAIFAKAEADAKAIYAKAKTDADTVAKSKAVAEIEASLELVVKAVKDHVSSLAAPTPPTA